jgi:DNA polymerase-3 subunit delta
MVALPRQEQDAFCEDPDSRYPFVLIYGPNRGLVSERIDCLLKNIRGKSSDAFSVVALEGDTLASDSGRLADEARTIGLFGDRRILHVRAGSRSFVDSLKALLADPPAETWIVIEAGNLDGKAALRAACEASKVCAVIPCYEDDARQLGALVDGAVARAGMTIDRDAREALVSLTGADRLSTRAEIEKLLFYAGDRKRIALDDVRAVVADASALALDDVLDAAAAGHAAAMLRALSRVREAGVAPGTLMNAAIRHLSQLHRLALQVEQGVEIDNAMKSGRVFFRRQNDYRAALRRLGARSLEQTIIAFGAAELESRRMPQLGDAIAERALLSLAERGKRKTG